MQKYNPDQERDEHGRFAGRPDLKTSDGKEMHEILTSRGYQYKGTTIVGGHKYEHPSGAKGTLYEKTSTQRGVLMHNGPKGGFMDLKEIHGPNDSLIHHLEEKP